MKAPPSQRGRPPLGRASSILSKDQAIIALRGEVARLRAFALEIIDWHLGSLDGCEIEDAAVRNGLAAWVEVTEPCEPEDACACAEYGFPSRCFRVNAAIRGEAPKETE